MSEFFAVRYTIQKMRCGVADVCADLHPVPDANCNVCPRASLARNGEIFRSHTDGKFCVLGPTKSVFCTFPIHTCTCDVHRLTLLRSCRPFLAALLLALLRFFFGLAVTANTHMCRARSLRALMQFCVDRYASRGVGDSHPREGEEECEVHSGWGGSASGAAHLLKDNAGVLR